MGYSIELFTDSNINDGYICSICFDVLKGPILLEPCEHAFCQSCIEEWRTSSNTCPVDRQEIAALKQPQHGCDVKVKLGNISDHRQHCEFNPDNKAVASQGDCGNCGAMLTQVEVDTAPPTPPTHDCVAYLKSQLQATTDKLKLCEIRLSCKGTELGYCRRKIVQLKSAASRNGLPPPPLLLEPQPGENPFMPRAHPTNPTKEKEQVVALYDYTAERDDELSFEEDSIICVLHKNDDGWWEGSLNGKVGMFPGNFVQPL